MATFVMVHGADQVGWIWKPVATRLRAAGHVAYAPTLDGCAERRHQVRRGITVATHAQEIADFLFYEDLREVVLAGTSSGGMVILKAAELARERIARLCFVDALALLPGERVDALVNRPTPREADDLTTAYSRADAENRMFKDLDPSMRAWALDRITPHLIAALEGPMVSTTFWDQPWSASVIRCTHSVNPPEAHQRIVPEGSPGAKRASASRLT